MALGPLKPLKPLSLPEAPEVPEVPDKRSQLGPLGLLENGRSTVDGRRSRRELSLHRLYPLAHRQEGRVIGHIGTLVVHLSSAVLYFQVGIFRTQFGQLTRCHRLGKL